MFFGGLNGDGFYNEEYSDGAYEHGEGASGYREPTKLKDLSLTKTGVETKKAMQFQFRNIGTIWLPKKALVKPHHNYVDDWAVKLVTENIRKLIASIQKRK